MKSSGEKRRKFFRHSWPHSASIRLALFPSSSAHSLSRTASNSLLCSCMLPCLTNCMHSRRNATLADAVGHGQGRDQSTVTDWRACRFIVIGIAPFAAHPPTKGRWLALSPVDGVQAFVKVCFSFSSLPSSANIYFTAAFYISSRSGLTGLVTFFSTTHSLLLGSIHPQNHIENPLMFTPPPSPLPPRSDFTDPSVPSLSLSPPLSPYESLSPVPVVSQPPLKIGARKGGADASMLAVQDRKRRTAWRTGLTVMILPLLLALFTLYARFASRPPFLDSLAGLSPGTRVNSAAGTVRAGYSPHELHGLHPRQNRPSTVRSDEPTSTSASSAAGVAFPSKTLASSPTQAPPPPPSGTVPTIPSSPPVLPTPFPQPFDTTLTRNFTTNSCETFFLNMTQSLPFRQCRPFSFLSQVSSSFLQVSACNISQFAC